MAFERISKGGLAAIGDMNGGLNDKAFFEHFRRVNLDCQDRPLEPKARKITITVDVKPVCTQDGACTDVTIESVQFKSTLPPHVSRPVELRAFHDGDAAWNNMAEDNPSQMTIDE